jgi:hypothetical protein
MLSGTRDAGLDGALDRPRFAMAIVSIVCAGRDVEGILTRSRRSRQTSDKCRAEGTTRTSMEDAS